MLTTRSLYLLLFLSFGVNTACFSKDPLLDAASDGDLTKLKSLIANGASVHTKSKGGWTALHYAVWGGRGDDVVSPEAYAERLEMVKFLLKKGAKVNAKESDGQTPIMWSYRADITELLMKNGASITIRSKSKEPAYIHILYSANRHKDYIPILKLLLAAGINVNSVDKDKNTLLMRAVSRKQPVEAATLLLKRGAKVNLINKRGETALMMADSIPVIKLLVEHRANIRQKDRRGRTVFDHISGNLPRAMSKEDKSEFFKSLFAFGIGPTIHDAAQNEMIDYFQRKIDKKTLNSIDKRNKRTALHYAIDQGNVEITRLLIEAGARLDIKDRSNNLPIDYAVTDYTSGTHQNAKYGRVGMGNARLWHKEIFELLLKHNAKVNPERLLLNAVRSNDPDLLDRIVKTWNIKLPKQNGEYVYDAVDRGAQDSVKWLIANGFEVNAVVGNKFTPLHVAVLERNRQIVQILLDGGAQKSLSIKANGKTPADYAKDASMRSYLLEAIPEKDRPKVADDIKSSCFRISKIKPVAPGQQRPAAMVNNGSISTFLSRYYTSGFAIEGDTGGLLARGALPGALDQNNVFQFLNKATVVTADKTTYIFEGDYVDPITFVLTAEKGLVYLKGKGRVTIKGKKTVRLPCKK